MRFNDIQAACIRSDERRNNRIENLSKYHRLINTAVTLFVVNLDQNDPHLHRVSLLEWVSDMENTLYLESTYIHYYLGSGYHTFHHHRNKNFHRNSQSRNETLSIENDDEGELVTVWLTSCQTWLGSAGRPAVGFCTTVLLFEIQMYRRHHRWPVPHWGSVNDYYRLGLCL